MKNKKEKTRQQLMEELEALRAFHARHDRLHESLLRTAVTQAEAPTIPHVLWQLQFLLTSGDP